MHSKNHALVSIIEYVKSIVDTLLSEKKVNYGIPGPAIDWFKFYLQGRSHFVTVDTEVSNNHPQKLAVPHGSILGPLLFLIFINDFQNHNNKAYHFADDFIPEGVDLCDHTKVLL